MNVGEAKPSGNPDYALINQFLDYGASTAYMRTYLDDPINFNNRPEQALDAILLEGESIRENRLMGRIHPHTIREGNVLFGLKPLAPFFGDFFYFFDAKNHIDYYSGWITCLNRNEVLAQMAYIEVPCDTGNQYALSIRATSKEGTFFDFTNVGELKNKHVERAIAASLSHEIENAASFPQTKEGMCGTLFSWLLQLKHNQNPNIGERAIGLLKTLDDYWLS